ncbi:MAG: hypothetical protein IPP66_23115 [Anaerolineales bacterium]|nr:hypothetical protein [Anaerolineales bacterium]
MESTKKVDWILSKRIAEILDARLGECLANAVRAFLDYPEILPPDAIFIEGVYNYGGQFSPHTWLETTNNIIELSLIYDTNLALRNHVQYYPIQSRDKTEIKKIYGDKPRQPGSSLMMKIDFDDERVVKLLSEVDTPPELKHFS